MMSRPYASSVASISSCMREMLNWVTLEGLELAQLRDVVVHGTEQAEAVDDVIRDEVRVRVAGPAVVDVVVAGAPADVVGERVRDVVVLSRRAAAETRSTSGEIAARMTAGTRGDDAVSPAGVAGTPLGWRRTPPSPGCAIA